MTTSICLLIGIIMQMRRQSGLALVETRRRRRRSTHKGGRASQYYHLLSIRPNCDYIWKIPLLDSLERTVSGMSTNVKHVKCQTQIEYLSFASMELHSKGERRGRSLVCLMFTLDKHGLGYLDSTWIKRKYMDEEYVRGKWNEFIWFTFTVPVWIDWIRMYRARRDTRYMSEVKSSQAIFAV